MPVADICLAPHETISSEYDIVQHQGFNQKFCVEGINPYILSHAHAPVQHKIYATDNFAPPVTVKCP